MVARTGLPRLFCGTRQTSVSTHTTRASRPTQRMGAWFMSSGATTTLGIEVQRSSRGAWTEAQPGRLRALSTTSAQPTTEANTNIPLTVCLATAGNDFLAPWAQPHGTDL